MSESILHTIRIGIAHQMAAWLIVGVVCLIFLGWFGLVCWMLDSTASHIYRTDGQMPPIIDRPLVTSLKGSAAKGFQRHHQQMSASIIAFRRVH